MTSVIVLGASGMLGSMLVDVLSAEAELEVAATVRSQRVLDSCRERLPNVMFRAYDAATNGDSLARALDGARWVVNAIGLTKPYVHDDDPAEVERAIRINAEFPFTLAKAANAIGAQVIQIATDCVFSGTVGRYVESSPHDPLDVYGKTKSLGEAALPGMHLLRCSIIGPEPASHAFLLEWVRRQPDGSTVNGYVDHLWNGVTTYAFSRLCLGVISGGISASGLQHVIPADDITKADLVATIAKAYGRDDITVAPARAPHGIDRTLRTEQPEVNATLWVAAGYSAPPSVSDMVHEMSRHAPRLAGLAT